MINVSFGYDFGEKCTMSKGEIVDTWSTGDDECNATSTQYSCGGVYNHNYMDVVGNRSHDCFWDCSKCKYGQLDKFKT